MHRSEAKAYSVGEITMSETYRKLRAVEEAIVAQRRAILILDKEKADTSSARRALAELLRELDAALRTCSGRRAAWLTSDGVKSFC